MYGEVRVTVQEFAELSKISKQDINAWRQALLSESPEITPQELEQIITLLVTPNNLFYAGKSHFWEEQIPKVENNLRNADAEELIAIFHDAPAFYVSNLLHHHQDNLIEYLWSLKQAIKEGTLKLSELQKKILLTLYEQTIMAIMPAEWTPTELLESRTRADCSAVSRALKRLEGRGLIVRQLKTKGSIPRHTTHVSFTHLGFLVTKQIFHSQEDNAKQSFFTSFKTKLRNG